jgi:hypothetical protein
LQNSNILYIFSCKGAVKFNFFKIKNEKLDLDGPVNVQKHFFISLKIPSQEYNNWYGLQGFTKVIFLLSK